MNPYKVLGVSENDSDSVIRAAYLKLVKKYHPDHYGDNPLKDLAAEKLKEINLAYDTIQKERAGQKNTNEYSYGGNYDNASYSTDGSGYSGQYAQEFSRVRGLMNAGKLHEATAVLEAIGARNAEWHYLYGVISFRMGDYSTAYAHLQQAVNMEPGNAEYRRAYDVLMNRGSRSYHNNYNNNGGSDSCSTACNVCSTLWCMDSCCECMGGDLIRCC